MTRLLSRMRRGAFGLALLAMLVGSSCSSGRTEPIPRGAVVVALGDSITAGFGLTAEQAWPSHLAAASGWRVINAGVSGDTVADGRARLGALLDAYHPAAVIVELGGNDMLHRQPLGETVSGLEGLLKDIRATGARPVLVATPEPNLAAVLFNSPSNAAFYSEIGRRLEVPVVDETIGSVLSRPELRLDQIHPNAEGHRVLGEQMIRKLRKAGLLG